MSKFRIGVGTVQAYVTGDDPFWMRHFGRPEYQREKPILTESLRSQVQPIVDALNTGTINIATAEKQLDLIRY